MSRKILVTGASAGIGRAVCEARLQAGDRVVGLARDFGKCPGAGQEGCDAIEIDLADLDALPDRLAGIAAAHPDLDALVCNAGEAVFGHLEQFSFGGIRRSLDLNFTSQVFLVRAFLPDFRKRGSGDVVMIGSESALRGGRRGSLYSASKFALRGFAQSMREETAASGIRFILVNPGMVRTGFHDNLEFRPGPEPGQHLLPSDVAEAVSLALDARGGAVIDEIDLSPQKRVIDFGRRD